MAEEALKVWLATQPGWLLILDNADDPALLMAFVPRTDNGHILITSRARNFQRLGIVKPVRLDELLVEDATAFLLHRCDRQDDDSEERRAAEELAHELDGLPLALEQTAAYIVDQNASLQDYLQSYRSRRLELIQYSSPAFGYYEKTVASAWAANFEAVEKESPAAADVLRLSAFLAPDAIPFELLIQGVSEIGTTVADKLSGVETNPLAINELLQPLGRFSLIHIDRVDRIYSIHRIVQEVLKASMDETASKLWAEYAVRATCRAFPKVEYGNWPLCNRLLPHARALTDMVLAARMRSSEAAQLLLMTGSYLYRQGQYVEAERLYKKALKINREMLGEHHPDYAASLNDLAMVYADMGRHAEAEPLYEEALAIRREALGERHPDYAQTLNNLATLYGQTDRGSEALTLVKEATAIRREALGERHADYAQSLNNLAAQYVSLGRYTEAEPLHQEAMEIRREVLGERHPHYAQSLNNLATLYFQTGRAEKAEPLFKEALEIRRESLGERHLAYTHPLNNLATLYDNLGRHAEAEPLYRELMAIYREVLGERHPRYAHSLQSLATLYLAQNRHAEAEPLFKELMELRRQSQAGSDGDRAS